MNKIQTAMEAEMIIDIKLIGYQDLDWMELPQDSVQRLGFVKTRITFSFHKTVRFYMDERQQAVQEDSCTMNSVIVE
jgi:hypothetical protein